MDAMASEVGISKCRPFQTCPEPDTAKLRTTPVISGFVLVIAQSLNHLGILFTLSAIPYYLMNGHRLHSFLLDLTLG